MLSRVFGKRHQKEHPPVCTEEGNSVILQERPKICLVDIDTDAREAMTSAGLNCTAASFGSRVRLPNEKVGDSCRCRCDHDIPSNLHEYDIVVVDLKDREPIQYDLSQGQLRDSSRASQWFLLCEFPLTVFDPRPFVGSLFRDTIQEIQGRESVVVVFATRREDVSYQALEVTATGYVSQGSLTRANYSFLPSPPDSENKTGLETTVVVKNVELADLLQRHNREFRYGIVFGHPTAWEDRQPVKDPHFLPLVTNSAGETVSYGEIRRHSVLYVFPQLEDKTSFLLEFFQSHLPAVVPHLFPFSTQFAWLNDEQYQLPNESKLLAEKQALEQEYADKIAAKEREIEENHLEYQFLHDLLTDTGAKLVKAAEEYSAWLGFDDVVNCDDAHPGRKEEDLQISLEQGLLVVELKGIGGTSKDSECSQISKIKYRRARERSCFDVFALYVVNHQRYLPPENRVNPPFTKQQIEDAEADERGLVTTYDLFKLYFAIGSGFITREDARRSLLAFGLVRFKPSDSAAIGRPLEVHYNGTVGVFALRDVTVQLGDELIVYEDGRCRKVNVVGLRDQDEHVAEASEGEIGMELSGEITEESELWKREVVRE